MSNLDKTMTRAALLLALFACSDNPSAPAPSPQARVVDAAALLTKAIADTEKAGYKVYVNVTGAEGEAPRVGVLLVPR
jgi:uncharacterized membrane protein YgcG